MWNLNLDAPFYSNWGNLRLDDMAAGLVLLQGVPFHLLRGRAVFLYCQTPPEETRFVRSFQLTLPEPQPVAKIHILGMVAPHIDPQNRPTAALFLRHWDGAEQRVELYAESLSCDGNRRDLPLSYTTTRVWANRDACCHMATISADSAAPLTEIEIADENPIESLLIMGITVEVINAEGEEI